MSETTSTTKPVVAVDIQPFCASENEGRHLLADPFVMRGHLYATDGRVLVRVPTDEPDTPQPDTGRVYPNAPSIIGEEDWADCNIPWPKHDGTTHLVRQDCACSTICTACKGCGVCICDCGHEHDCAKCGGSGEEVKPTCQVCQGNGWVKTEEPTNQRVAQRLIAAKYFEKIAALPGVMYRDYRDGDFMRSGIYKPLAFVADGGLQGLVSPVRG